jgi:type I restriction enzyme S subunit
MSAIIDYRGKTPQKVSFGVPLITAKIVKGGRVLDAEEFIAESDYVAWMRRGMPLPGDVVVTTEAPLGEVAQLDDRKIALAQRLIGLRGKPDRLDNTFLRFAMQAAIVQDQLASRASGTTVLGIRQAELRHVEIPLPPLPEQRSIARVLGGLDDKIELNRRMNRTLEDLARGVFRSWFVDFDPVLWRAGAAGTARGVTSHTPHTPPPLHWPARLVDPPAGSALGPIPEGWRVGLAGELAEFVLGGDWGKDTESTDTPAPAYCIRGADIPSLQAGGRGKMPVRYLDQSSLNKRALRAGDLVVEISGGSPTQSTGRPVLVGRPLLGKLSHPLVCSNFCRIFRPKPNLSTYTYLWLRSLYEDDVFLQYENGTTGIKNFAFTIFCERQHVLFPPDAVLQAFAKTVDPIFEIIGQNGIQSDSLATLRDALLPQLLSGEIRLREAERAVGESLHSTGTPRRGDEVTLPRTGKAAGSTKGRA